MDYSLNIGVFKVKDSKLFLAELRTAAPDIAEEMYENSGFMVFEPDEPWGSWRNQEDKAIPVIEKHILTGSYCEILWDAEDGQKGGSVVVKGKSHPIIYNPMVAVTDENGNDLEVPLYEFTNNLKSQTKTECDIIEAGTGGAHVCQGCETCSIQPISQ